MIFDKSDEQIRTEVATQLLLGMIAVGDLRYLMDKVNDPYTELALRAIDQADALLIQLKRTKPK